jgi:Icc-related predicted phosphoesterase
MTLPEFSKPIKFYGSPWTPPFFNWAFMADETKIKKKWKLIPKDTDILITHGPAQGILDIIKMKSVGCQHLRERIEKINPCLHVSGHIHFSNGVAMVKDTIYVNASICTEKYKPHQKPKVVDIIEVNKKLVAEWKDI